MALRLFMFGPVHAVSHTLCLKLWGAGEKDEKMFRLNLSTFETSTSVQSVSERDLTTKVLKVEAITRCKRPSLAAAGQHFPSVQTDA